MRNLRRLSLLVTLVLSCVLGSRSSDLAAQSSNELALADVEAPQGTLASVPLTLSSTDHVEGLTAVFEWGDADLTGEDLVAGAAISGADVVVRRVEASYMVLGVVIDSDGQGTSVIPPGEGQVLATAKIRVASGAEVGKKAALEFVDNKYASIQNGPVLENLVTVGGLSIAAAEGLGLTAGSITATPRETRFDYRIATGDPVPGAGCGPARVLLDATEPVEGYEIALGHPAGLTLDRIDIGAAAVDAGADFTTTEVLAAGGVVGVVLDLTDPFLGNVIPPGTSLEIAAYRYCCPAVSQNTPYALEFADGVLGTPPKDNIVVTGGISYPANVEAGTFTCGPVGGEICDDGIDNDGDDLVDCDDPDCETFPACIPTDIALGCGAPALGQSEEPLPASGVPGGVAKVTFYYRSLVDAVQGISMAICTPCDAAPKEGTYDISGTIVEAVGAEYVNHQADTDPNDGDGCELIVGILVDSLPPFEGGTLPATERYLSVGTIDFAIADDPALAGICLPVTFCDGANGPGKVPIRNLFSIGNESRKPFLASCDICIEEEGLFYRGDCNYSFEGAFAVDIADAAATVSFLLGDGPLKFQPPCLDACDCNDDGRIDLADVICVLKFLFESGPFPPAPGPGIDEDIDETPPGADPTPDGLGCVGRPRA